MSSECIRSRSFGLESNESRDSRRDGNGEIKKRLASRKFKRAFGIRSSNRCRAPAWSDGMKTTKRRLSFLPRAPSLRRTWSRCSGRMLSRGGAVFPGKKLVRHDKSSAEMPAAVPFFPPSRIPVNSHPLTPFFPPLATEKLCGDELIRALLKTTDNDDFLSIPAETPRRTENFLASLATSREASPRCRRSQAFFTCESSRAAKR